MNHERMIFPEFRDEQSSSRYPFVDGASLQSGSGSVRLGAELFLDASIYPIGNRSRLHIRQIDVTPRKITIEIGDDSRRTLATAEFDPLAETNFTLRLVDAYGRDAGLLVSDPERLRIFASWPVGTHTFPIGNAEFVAACAIPTPEIGVRGFITETGEFVTGDAVLIGDNGIVLTEEDEHIRIDAVGDPLFVRRACLPRGKFTVPRYLRTINGQGPDAYGNFNLTVGDHLAENTVLRLYPNGHGGLRLEAIGRLAHE